MPGLHAIDRMLTTEVYVRYRTGGSADDCSQPLAGPVALGSEEEIKA